MKKTSAIFIDRDGVLVRAKVVNGKSFAPRKLKDFRLLPGAISSIAELKKKGFIIIVITNQPDIGNKKLSISTLNKMHKTLSEKTGIDDIFTCTHSQLDKCKCRKPRIGMIKSAKKKYNIDLENSFLIGDRSSDISAGKKAGCRTIFIDRKYREASPKEFEATFGSINGAVKYILKNHKKS